MPKNIIRSRAMQAIMLALLAFWPAAYFLPRSQLFDFVNAVSLTLGLGVLYAYRIGIIQALDAVRHNRIGRADFLVLGIAVTWSAVVFKITWLWGWRIMGEPDEGLDHVLFAYMTALGSIGAALHLMAPGVIAGQIPRTSWVSVGASFLSGLWLGLLVALLL